MPIGTDEALSHTIGLIITSKRLGRLLLS